jgi:hypothetical protein
MDAKNEPDGHKSFIEGGDEQDISNVVHCCNKIKTP